MPPSGCSDNVFELFQCLERLVPISGYPPKVPSLSLDSAIPLSPPKTLKGNQSGSLFSCLIVNTLRTQLSNSKVISELHPFCFVCMFIQDNPTKKMWNRVIFLLETKRRLCRQLTLFARSGRKTVIM
jgi:hypothetical protein